MLQPFNLALLWLQQVQRLRWEQLDSRRSGCWGCNRRRHASKDRILFPIFLSESMQRLQSMLDAFTKSEALASTVQKKINDQSNSMIKNMK